jgi:ATPase family associated with various cellular activities (AAA)
MSNNNLDAFGTEPRPPHSKRSTRPRNPVAVDSGESKTDEERDILNSIALVQWAVCGPHTYKPVSSTFEKLESGVYGIAVSQYHGIIYQKKNIKVDNLLRFPDSVSDKILAEVTTFWNNGAKFLEHGFLHRRGYLFHGPAGSGKTCLVHQIIADIVQNNGLVFQCSNHPSVFNDGLAQYRKVEPDRPVVCLFEDIDAIIDEHGEDEILTLLDGENQIDKVLNIATTNYPEKLDKRLVARPRRFDRVLKIDMPSALVRKLYFQKKLNIPDEEIEKWVEVSDGFSFAACAELVISVRCFGNKFDDAVDRLKEMMNAKPSSTDYNPNLGFAGGMK